MGRKQTIPTDVRDLESSSRIFSLRNCWKVHPFQPFIIVVITPKQKEGRKRRRGLSALLCSPNHLRHQPSQPLCSSSTDPALIHHEPVTTFQSAPTDVQNRGWIPGRGQAAHASQGFEPKVSFAFPVSYFCEKQRLETRGQEGLRPWLHIGPCWILEETFTGDPQQIQANTATLPRCCT